MANNGNTETTLATGITINNSIYCSTNFSATTTSSTYSCPTTYSCTSNSYTGYVQYKSHEITNVSCTTWYQDCYNICMKQQSPQSCVSAVCGQASKTECKYMNYTHKCSYEGYITQ